MTLTVWVGAVVASRQFENGHIKIDILDTVVRNERLMAGVSVVWQIVAIATMAYFTKLSWDYTVYMKTINMMMAGIRFPMWVFVAAMTVCSFFMFVYEIAHLCFVISDKLRAPRQDSREGG
jgi:TRAP-type C4-dicarboxylate transport system permease small subunit